MKRIILNTADADEISTDKKDYKYYFKKPIVVNETSTLSLQAISQVQGGNIGLPTSSGLIHISGLTPFVIYGTNMTYGWSLNAGGYVEEMEVDLTDVNEAIVVGGDGFTTKTPGVDFYGGRIKCLIYNDTTTTFPSPQTLLVISEVMDMGYGFEAGWLLGIRKRPAGVTYTGAGAHPTFEITSVKDSSINQGGIYKYQEQVESFNPIFDQYAGEASQSDANFTSSDITLGQGLVVKMGADSANPTLIEVKSITDGGYGHEVGDYIYVNKKDIGLPYSGTNFLLPVKLQVISTSNKETEDPALGYKITAKNLKYHSGNIKSSDANTNVLLYNKQNVVYTNTNEIMDYKCCNIPPQVIMGMEINIENFDGSGLSTDAKLIMDLKIS